MPLFYQQHINQHTQIAIWKIEEEEDFFLEKIAAQRKILNQQKRLQHLAARYLLNILIPNFDINKVEITETGKPFLLDNEFYFSISHTNNYAAVIVSSKNNVAIDIEFNNEKVLKILHKFLCDDEIIKMNEIIANKGLRQLPTIIWSAKETMFKWYAKGSIDFKTMLKIDVTSIENSLFQSQIYINKKQISLSINYKILDEICLTFIAD